MKIFVTGGTGFVGSHVVDALLAEGHDVVCLVRSPEKAARVFPEQGPILVEGTLANERAITQGIAGADVVYHIAGLTTARSRDELFGVNAGATQRVVALAEQHAADLQRFIYVSSLAAAGPTRPGHPLDETHPPAPISDYGRSKLEGEHAVQASPLPWTVVRPPPVYGPRDREFLKVAKMVRSPVVPLMGRRDQEFSFIYVADLTAALLHARHENGRDKTYFASHPETVTGESLIHDIARAVLGPERAPPRLLPIPRFVTRGTLGAIGTAAKWLGRATVLNRDKANEFLAEAWTCSAKALRQDTGWEATTTSADGWERAVAWYREQGWL